MAKIALEDGHTDVLAKALRGLRIGASEAAKSAGLDGPKLLRLLDGELDVAALKAVAPVLGLGADSLVALAEGRYQPEVAAPEGLAQFNTPYDDYFVNAYLVWDPATKQAIAFDTGSTAEPMLAFAKSHGLSIELILLTHTHGDHILDLAKLKAATGAPAHIAHNEPTEGAEAIQPGHRFQVGALQVEARRTSGHTVGGMSYLVEGLAQPVVAVGDALFAGSMGGGLVSFREALDTNRAALFTLADNTVVCPGHGPLTTIGLEKANNPFHPEFQGA